MHSFIEMACILVIHCWIVFFSTQVYVENLSEAGNLLLNKASIHQSQKKILYHNDIVQIGDRCFRWEYDEQSPHRLLSNNFSFATPTRFTGEYLKFLYIIPVGILFLQL